jgi:uncharacterized phage protein (TIGR02218 family)
MRTLHPGLAAHIAGDVTTLCNCWRVTRADGVVLGFTDHDRTIRFDGVDFEAGSGFAASRVEHELGLGVANQEVSGAFDSARLTPDDLRAGRYDGARVETFTVNWSDPAERVLMQVATVGEASEADGAFRVELRSLSSDMDETRGRRFSRACDANLGDARCAVDLDQPAYRAVAVVAAAETDLVLRMDGLSAFSAGWFRGGNLRFDTGQNAGVTVPIAEHVARTDGAIVELWKPIPFPVAAGATATLTAGCDKTFLACREKFANGSNFRGFPHIPGNDFALGYASSFRVMDGGPLVP